MRRDLSKRRPGGLVPTAALSVMLAAAVAIGGPGLPAFAADPEPRPDMEEFKRRLDEAWDDMMRELGPTIDSLGALIDTLDQIDGLENYERPEVLPNGDIVIRRKADAPPLPDEPERAPTETPEDDGKGIKT
ncbi:AAA+ family ATPase [Thermohalobaculum xanthum]|nr:AAA+ family ATPase [Thermohalobaculum xanthum]